MQLVLLLRLSGAVEGPGDLGDGSSGDGGRDPDGGPGSAVQQVVGAHVQSHAGLDWAQREHTVAASGRRPRQRR